MKTIKKALLGLLLAGCAATSAFATPTYDYQDYFFVDADMGPGTTQSWRFGAGQDTVLAGQTFAYEFLFNTPPAAATTLFQFWVDGMHQVAFDHIWFAALGNTLSPVPDFSFYGNEFQLRGEGLLDSGLYDLFLAGTFLTDGASFQGFALDTDAPVPEPATLGLLGAGVAALIKARRRGGKPLTPAKNPC